jgi:hypothetical protein
MVIRQWIERALAWGSGAWVKKSASAAGDGGEQAARSSGGRARDKGLDARAISSHTRHDHT